MCKLRGSNGSLGEPMRKCAAVQGRPFRMRTSEYAAYISRQLCRSTRSRDNAGGTEFRNAAAFDGSGLKRLLIEAYYLAFDNSSCSGWWWSPRVRAAKSEDALMTNDDFICVSKKRSVRVKNNVKRSSQLFGSIPDSLLFVRMHWLPPLK